MLQLLIILDPEVVYTYSHFFHASFFFLTHPNFDARICIYAFYTEQLHISIGNHTVLFSI